MANETNVPAKAMVRYKESFRCAHLIGAVDNIAVVSVDMIIVVVDAKKISRVCNNIINIYLYDRRIDGWMQKYYNFIRRWRRILLWYKQNGGSGKSWRISSFESQIPAVLSKTTYTFESCVCGDNRRPSIFYSKNCVFLVERFLQKSRFCMKKIGRDNKKRRNVGKRHRSKRLVVAVADR
jgi:hypothetical protein